MSPLGIYIGELALLLRDCAGGDGGSSDMQLLQWHVAQLHDLTTNLRRRRRRRGETETNDDPKTEPESAPVVLLGGGGGEPEDHQPPQVKRSRSE